MLKATAQMPVNSPNSNWFWQAFAVACDNDPGSECAKAGAQWSASLKILAESDDKFIANGNYRVFYERLSRISEVFEQRKIPASDPAILGIRTLKSLDRAAFQAAGFSLTGIDGRTYSLAENRGKPVLVVFSTSTCRDCEKMWSALEEICQQGNIAVLAITPEKAQAVESFVRANGITFPVLLDSDQRVERQFGIDGWAQGLPMAVVFDAAGGFVDHVAYPLTRENMLAALR